MRRHRPDIDPLAAPWWLSLLVIAIVLVIYAPAIAMIALSIHMHLNVWLFGGAVAWVAIVLGVLE